MSGFQRVVLAVDGDDRLAKSSLGQQAAAILGRMPESFARFVSGKWFGFGLTNNRSRSGATRFALRHFGYRLPSAH
ncbi:MAG: hypothetical protein IT353_06650 [Gemmatimonadaceae bacterium]|nr:hypothetical protein [Gemmatimonadaceae bacterium]